MIWRFVVRTMQVITPGRSDDGISTGLRLLTYVFSRGEETFGGLGGSYGYGFDLENDVFLMHCYCWCEKDDCRWCGEECAPNFWHKPSGLKIWWYKYIGRGMQRQGKLTHAKWTEVLRDCLKSLNAPPLEACLDAYAAAEDDDRKQEKVMWERAFRMAQEKSE